MEKLAPKIAQMLIDLGLEIRSSQVLHSNILEVVLKDGSYCLFSQTDDGYWIRYPDGKTELVKQKENNLFSNTASSINKNDIKSPATGKVESVLVTEGDIVESGQLLLKIESMKMEIEVRSSSRMKIQNLHVKAGDLVQFGQLLVKLLEVDPGN